MLLQSVITHFRVESQESNFWQDLFWAENSKVWWASGEEKPLRGFKLHFLISAGPWVRLARLHSLAPFLMVAEWGTPMPSLMVAAVPNSGCWGRGQEGSLWCPHSQAPRGVVAVEGARLWFGESSQMPKPVLFLANVTSGNCSGALTWIIILTFLFFNKHLFPERGNPVLFFF